MIDWTISIGNIIEVTAIVGGGAAVAISMRNDIAALKTTAVSMQAEIRNLSDVITKMAVAETRLDNSDTRITNIEQDIRDLRHGKGFVRGPHGIEREFP